MMQDQLDKKRAETAAIRSVVDKAKRVLEGLGSLEVGDGAGKEPGAASTSEDGQGEVRINERELAVWEAMESDFA